MPDDHMQPGDAPTRSVGPTIGADTTGLDPDAPPFLTNEEVFGPYVVVRLLGRGGMGEVYEVEDRENGRRVALKVLSNRLSTPADRARFIREGRLAAGISHPNTVYVYGTDDIKGVPVIAMELAPGGTLKDRVKARGPLPAAEAVDAILQVISGLEAAADAGVLHRDIKPSNCFIDSDGTLKVGDFGLSISTQAFDERSLTMLGTVLGTPGFSSPEQLRGDELDVRSDIYSVGATLYYLLTGRPPFDDPNVIRLVTQVAQEMPQSPRVARPDVPGDLADVVMQCLAKRPADRFANYEALRAALEPFSSNAPAPAPLGIRFAAGLVDNLLLTVLTVPIASWIWGSFAPTHRDTMVKGTLVSWAAMILYYGLLEGGWGRSIGKQLFGLRVVDATNQRPGIPRGVYRATTWTLADGVPLLVFTYLLMPVMTQYQNTPMGAVFGFAVPVVSLVILALLFSTARRANGFAAVHDLITGTRVILKRRMEDRVRAAAPAAVPLPVSRREQAGPYVLLDERPLPVSDVVTGYDDRLRRKVWIHQRRPGAAPVESRRRLLARPARLRWLGGRRTETEAWDAYEAPEGAPLTSLLSTRRSWAEVRGWLHDLASEIRLAEAEGRLPVLALDRVWITPTGRAKLIDWGADSTPLAPQAFLHSLASRMASAPLPLHAQDFLGRLQRGAFPTTDAVVAESTMRLDEPATVRRGRRIGHILLAVLPATVMAAVMLATTTFIMWAQTTDPQRADLTECLMRLDRIRKEPQRARTPQEAESLEVYIAGHYAEAIRDPRTWTEGWSLARFNPTLRQVGERAVAAHPNPSSGELAAAAAVVEPFLAEERKKAQRALSLRGLTAVAAIFAAGATVVCAIAGLLSAALFRGGLMLRLFGIAVATAEGQAGRLRAFGRAVIAWSPALLSAVALWISSPGATSRLDWLVLEGISLVALTVGAIYAARNPTRGLQDRLAATWLVPR